MSPPDVGPVVCPMCSAENLRGAARCFLCGQSLSGATELAPPKPPGGPAAMPGATPRITSIMLLIALVAVFLGVFREAPGLALVLAIPGTIALTRTLAVAGGRPGPRSWFDHVVVFLATFAAVIIVAIAAVVSFFATCLAIVTTASGGDSLGAGLILGGIAGVAVLIGLTVAFTFWGRRTRSR